LPQSSAIQDHASSAMQMAEFGHEGEHGGDGDELEHGLSVLSFV
jgi:hypothetical protein